MNKAGDATITWRYSKKHNFLVAFLFPFVSTYWQQEPTKAFIDKARERNRPLYRQILTQYAVWGGTHAALLGLAMAMHGVAGGARIWAFAFLVPALFSLWTIMFFNYIQHVHTDPWSEHDHSRSFTGRLINFFLFNNGLHAVHHETPGLHWSLLPEAHAKIEAAMDPALKPVSFFAWCFRSYVVAPFLPRFGTAQVGRAPYERPRVSPWTCASGMTCRPSTRASTSPASDAAAGGRGCRGGAPSRRPVSFIPHLSVESDPGGFPSSGCFSYFEVTGGERLGGPGGMKAREAPHDDGSRTRVSFTGSGGSSATGAVCGGHE